MSIEPQDLCALAIQLMPGALEVERRASISRAYYAAYHFALQWESRLPCKGSEFGPQGGVHQKLINRLNSPGPACTRQQQTASKKLSFQLERLKAHRTFADYELNSNLRPTSAIQACADAKTILSTP